MEHVHTRNKQQTESEIKRTQEESVCKTNRHRGQRKMTCLCLGGPKKTTSSDPEHWTLTQQVKLPFSLNLHCDLMPSLFFCNTVNMGTVSSRWFPVDVHVCSRPLGSTAPLFVWSQYARLHSTLVGRREQTDIVGSDLFCVWGMSTEAAGGFGSHSLTSDGLTLTFRVDHLLFPQG